MSTQMVTIHVEPATAAILQEKAAAHGLTVDAYLRQLAESDSGAESLSGASATGHGAGRKSLLGAFQHMKLEVTPVDIQEVRREMWQNFPHEIPE